MRLVIVDDEPVLLGSLRRLLRDEFSEIECFVSPLEALAALTARPADVVLTDYAMPEMTGLQLLEQIRRQAPGARRVMVSATGLFLSPQEIAVADAVVGKPWTRRTLRLALGLDARPSEESPCRSSRESGQPAADGRPRPGRS